MNKLLGKLGLAAALAATTVSVADTAEARDRHFHRHGGDDAALAVGAGIIGLAIGAAIASSDDDDGYYYPDGGYYAAYPPPPPAYVYDYPPPYPAAYVYYDGYRRPYYRHYRPDRWREGYYHNRWERGYRDVDRYYHHGERHYRHR